MSSYRLMEEEQLSQKEQESWEERGRLIWKEEEFEREKGMGKGKGLIPSSLFR